MNIRLSIVAVASVALLVGGGASASAAVQATAQQPCAQPDGRVSTMAMNAGTLYVGGSFTHVKDRAGVSRVRSGLAAVDVATCELKDWTAAADGEVLALAVSGSTVYVGGAFLHVGGAVRNRLAALDSTTAEVAAFSPVVNKPVRALAASNTTLYAGGEFTKIGGSARPMLAAFDLGSGSLDQQWQPKPVGKVYTLAITSDASRVYAGGNFTTLNGQADYAFLAAVNPTTGAIDSGFQPRSRYPVLKLVTDARGVYVGQAGSGGHLLLINHDGSLQQPIYQTDGDVQAVAVDGNSVFAGGHFTNYCVGNTGAGAPFQCNQNLPRRKLFEVSLISGNVTSWAPSLNSPFGALSAAVDPATHTLFVGGDFTKVNSATINHLAVFRSA